MKKLGITSYSGGMVFGRLAVHQLKNGDTLTLSYGPDLAYASRLSFRGKQVAKAGNFFLWGNLDDFFNHRMVKPAFKRILAELIERGEANREVRFTIAFNELVGWSRTINQGRIMGTAVELRELNSKAKALFVTDRSVGAPLTHCANVVCRLNQNMPNNWRAIVCMVSPGPTPGELKGNVSDREHLYFFDLSHPGSSQLIFV